MSFDYPTLPPFNTTYIRRPPLFTDTTQFATTPSNCFCDCNLSGVSVPYLPDVDDNENDEKDGVFNTSYLNNTISDDFVYGNNQLMWTDFDFVGASLSATIMLFVQLIFIITSIRMCCGSQSSKSHKNGRFSMQYTQLLTVCIYIIYILSATTTIIRSYAHYSDETLIKYICEIILAVFNALNAILLYIFMILRLTQTFNGTMYAITTCIKVVHTINISIIALLYLFLPFLYFQKQLSMITKYVFLKKICLVLLFSLFGLGLIHLIYLFNQKLFALLLAQRQTSINNLDSIQRLNRPQLELMKVVQKHTVLGILIVLPTIILMIASLIVFEIKVSNELILFQWIIQTVCICMETLCLFLGFSNHSKLYKYCCHLCDSCCHYLCVEITKSKVRKLHTNIPKVEETANASEAVQKDIDSTINGIACETTADIEHETVTMIDTADKKESQQHESQATLSVNITPMEIDNFMNMIDEIEEDNDANL